MIVTDKDVKDIKIGEIDYAILKSVTLDINDIRDIIKILQIRTIIIEKHIYSLVKNGFLSYTLDKFTITSNGENVISSFERDNPEKWISINQFIVSTIEHQKEQKVKTYKIIDLILKISMIILIILIIYFGKDLLFR